MTGEATIIRAVSDAQKAFQRAMRQDESALENGDKFEFALHPKDWKISLEKGKRALDLADELADHGYYTTAIELCFYTMERAIETWVMKKKDVRGFRTRHGEVFNIACKNGLISETLSGQLGALWVGYRADQYYRPYVPTRKSAETMIRAAKAVMGFVKERL